MSPTPKKNEDRKSYVSRCIPIVLDEGTAKDPKQAAAICHSMFTQAEKADEQGVLLTHFDLVSLAKRSVAEKAGYFGGPAGEDWEDPHLNDDGSFKGGFDGCVAHMVACEGYEEVEAQNICSYFLGRQDMAEGPEEPDFTALGPHLTAKGTAPYYATPKQLKQDDWEDEFDSFGECIEYMMEEEGMNRREAERECSLLMKSADRLISKLASEKAYRARQTDPGKYEEFRYGKDAFGKGVSAVYGIYYKNGERTSEVQSIVFDDKKFTKAQAKAWLKEHDYSTSIEATGEAAEKDIEVEFGVEREADVATIAGRYPEPEKVEVPRKPSDAMALEEVELPAHLKSREFGTTQEPELSSTGEIPSKKLFGLEEVELPDKLKPRRYGEMEDEIPKLKQP